MLVDSGLVAGARRPPHHAWMVVRANAIVVGLRSAKWGFLENAAADRSEIWWRCSLCGTAPLRRSPGRGKMVCPSRISRAAVLGTSKQARARHWQPAFIPPPLSLFMNTFSIRSVIAHATCKMYVLVDSGLVAGARRPPHHAWIPAPCMAG